MVKSKMIYLAVPYTHKDKRVREKRYQLVTKVSALLVANRLWNFSPITQSHEQAKAMHLPRSWEFWRDHDREHILRCDEIWVLKLPGWRTSVGVQAEIKIAYRNKIPVRYISYNEKTQMLTLDPRTVEELEIHSKLSAALA